MSKVTITIVDDDEGEGVGVTFDFDPPIKNVDGSSETPAHRAAGIMLSALQTAGEVSDYAEFDDEDIQ